MSVAWKKGPADKHAVRHAWTLRMAYAGGSVAESPHSDESMLDANCLAQDCDFYAEYRMRARRGQVCRSMCLRKGNGKGYTARAGL